VLAKAMDGGKIDAPMTREDAEIVSGILKGRRRLDIDKLYKGLRPAGYIDPPGAGKRRAGSQIPTSWRRSSARA